MGRTNNTLNLGAGFNITGQQPIDSRIKVKNIEDIYLPETWEGVGLYNALIVADENGAVRVLKNRDDITNPESWKKIEADFTGVYNDEEEWEAE